MNLQAAELKSVAALSAGTLDEGLEIHKIVGQMVMAVANIAEDRPGTKTKGVGGPVSSSRDKSSMPLKRKRGRPRRKECEPIEQMISTSDSDNESLDALSKKLAKSYKETANLSLEVDENRKANLLLDVNEPLPIEQTIHEVETIASQILCDNEVESTITI
jgi:hypothetical protein